MQKFSNIHKNYFIMLFGNVFGQLMFFIAFTYLARTLGPAEFGMWNYSQIWMLFLIRVCEFGLEVVGVREVSRFQIETKKWIAIIVSTRLFLSLVVFTFFLILIYVLNVFTNNIKSLMLISAVTVFPMAFLMEWVLEAHQKFVLVSMARMFRGFLFFVFTYLWISSENQGELAAFFYLLSILLTCFALNFIVIRCFGFDWSSISISNGIGALKKSSPIAIAILLSHFSLYLPTIVVGHLLSKEELGFFSAANRIVLFLWAYIVTSMQRVLLPPLSQSFSQSKSNFINFIKKFFRVVTLISISIGLVVTFFGTFLMETLYSSRYQVSGTVLEIIIWGFVFYSIRYIFELALIVTEKNRLYIMGMLLLAISYLLLSPILTFYFGIIGASTSIVVSEFVYLVYLIYVNTSVDRSFVFQNLLRILTTSISIIILVKILVPKVIIIQCALGLVLFIIILILSNSIYLQDLKSLLMRKKNGWE